MSNTQVKRTDDKAVQKNSRTKQQKNKFFSNKFLIGVAAFLVTLLIGSILLFSTSSGYQEYFDDIFSQFSSSASVINLFNNFTWILLITLSMVVAYKAKLINLNSPGQMIAGGLTAYLFAVNMPSLASAGWIFTILLSMGAGMVMAYIVGALKTKLGIHEVITSVLLNWTIYSLYIFFTNPEYGWAWMNLSGIADPVASGYSLLMGNGLTWMIFIAVPLSLLFIYLYKKTRWGLKQKYLAHGKKVSSYAGYSTKREIVKTMMISGAISGLAGATMFFGTSAQSITIPGLSIAYIPLFGLQGLTLGFMAFMNPVWLLLTSFIGALFIGTAAVGDLNSLNVSILMLTTWALIVALSDFIVNHYSLIRFDKSNYYCEVFDVAPPKPTLLNDPDTEYQWYVYEMLIREDQARLEESMNAWYRSQITKEEPLLPDEEIVEIEEIPTLEEVEDEFSTEERELMDKQQLEEIYAQTDQEKLDLEARLKQKYLLDKAALDERARLLEEKMNKASLEEYQLIENERLKALNEANKLALEQEKARLEAERQVLEAEKINLLRVVKQQRLGLEHESLLKNGEASEAVINELANVELENFVKNEKEKLAKTKVELDSLREAEYARIDAQRSEIYRQLEIEKNKLNNERNIQLENINNELGHISREISPKKIMLEEQLKKLDEERLIENTTHKTFLEALDQRILIEQLKYEELLKEKSLKQQELQAKIEQNTLDHIDKAKYFEMVETIEKLEQEKAELEASKEIEIKLIEVENDLLLKSEQEKRFINENRRRTEEDVYADELQKLKLLIAKQKQKLEDEIVALEHARILDNQKFEQILHETKLQTEIQKNEELLRLEHTRLEQEKKDLLLMAVESDNIINLNNKPEVVEGPNPHEIIQQEREKLDKLFIDEKIRLEHERLEIERQVMLEKQKTDESKQAIEKMHKELLAKFEELKNSEPVQKEAVPKSIPAFIFRSKFELAKNELLTFYIQDKNAALDKVNEVKKINTFNYDVKTQASIQEKIIEFEALVKHFTKKIETLNATFEVLTKEQEVDYEAYLNKVEATRDLIVKGILSDTVVATEETVEQKLAKEKLPKLTFVEKINKDAKPREVTPLTDEQKLRIRSAIRKEAFGIVDDEKKLRQEMISKRNITTTISRTKQPEPKKEGKR